MLNVRGHLRELWWSWTISLCGLTAFGGGPNQKTSAHAHLALHHQRLVGHAITTFGARQTCAGCQYCPVGRCKKVPTPSAACLCYSKASCAAGPTCYSCSVKECPCMGWPHKHSSNARGSHANMPMTHGVVEHKGSHITGSQARITATHGAAMPGLAPLPAHLLHVSAEHEHSLQRRLWHRHWDTHAQQRQQRLAAEGRPSRPCFRQHPRLRRCLRE